MKLTFEKDSIFFKHFILLIMSLLLLFSGGLIYLYFRPHSLNMFSWLRVINCELFFQQRVYNNDSKLIEYLVFSLPNGLWILSFLILLGLIWRNKRSWFYVYSTLFTGISVIFEIFQKFGIIPGTFDFMDILALLIFHIFGILIYELIILEVSYEKQKLD